MTWAELLLYSSVPFKLEIVQISRNPICGICILLFRLYLAHDQLKNKFPDTMNMAHDLYL